jgi:hypothetical protein
VVTTAWNLNPLRLTANPTTVNTILIGTSQGPGKDARIILKCMLQERDVYVKVRAGLNWLKTEFNNGGHLSKL